MLRVLLFIHRYLAVAVGLVMALWCLSGFVMMYQPYPALTPEERLQGLEPLRFESCCRTQFLPGDAEPAGSFRIEMLRGEPVLRQPGAPPISLVSGVPVVNLQQAGMEQIAAGHARQRGIGGTPRRLADIGIDQWTIETARGNQPMRHFAMDDAAGTELYVNAATGEVFQDTSRRERVLGWMGAVPHWLYPTILRSNGPLWAQIVIWLSVAGTFLTATGLYVGISRLHRREGDGSLSSPFRGWWYWHHMAGLAFGVLTLTWVFSGLLTMNPWGWLEGSAVGERLRPQLEGEPPTSELRSFLEEAPAQLAAGGFTQLRSAPFNGRLYVLAQRADGSAIRLDALGRPALFEPDEVESVLGSLDTGLASLELLQEEDAYYYAHKGEARLPVWRAVLGDAQGTRLYLQPGTGSWRVVDGAARKARWIAQGLHSLDFAGLRRRPLWDIVTMLLLAGATVLCITGSWMAIQRVRRDLGGN